jgi:hypothetical protein
VYKGLYRDNVVAIKALKKSAQNQEEECIREFIKEFEIMRYPSLSLSLVLSPLFFLPYVMSN